MDFTRIRYEDGVMFVFRSHFDGKLYTVGIRRGGEEGEISRLAACANRKHSEHLLVGYYTPEGAVHTFDDGDEDAMFERLATIREYMAKAVERDIRFILHEDSPPSYDSRGLEHGYKYPTCNT